MTYLYDTRMRYNILLVISIMSITFCYCNTSPLILSILELLIVVLSIYFLKIFDIGQLQFLQKKYNLLWESVLGFWSVYYCLIPLLNMVSSGSDHLIIFDYLFPNRYCFSLRSLWTLLNKADFKFLIPVFLTVPLWYVIFRWLFYYIIEFFQKLSRIELTYLISLTTTLLALLIILSSKTSFFVYPADSETYVSEENTIIQYRYDGNENHFLDSDTGGLLEMPYYTIGDHSRHPYFSRVMTLFFPLLLLLSSVYNIFFNSYAYSFALGISSIQIVLYVLSGIFLMRLYSRIIKRRFAICLAILYICSFPVVFVFCPERLVFSSFFVILSLYLIVLSKIDDIYLTFVIFLTIGTTSLSLLPIGFACFLKCKMRCVLISVIPLCLLTVHNGLEWWKSNTIHLETTGTTSIQRVTSYNQLLQSCLFVPDWKSVNVSKSEVIKDDGSKVTISPKCSIQTTLKNSYLKTNITGFIILALSCFSAYVYRKKAIVQVSFFWLLVSIGLIGIMGFGNSQCVLYNTYFSWAVLPLAILPFNCFYKNNNFKLPVMILLYGVAVLMVVSNAYFIYQVVQIVSSRYFIPPGI